MTRRSAMQSRSQICSASHLTSSPEESRPRPPLGRRLRYLRSQQQQDPIGSPSKSLTNPRRGVEAGGPSQHEAGDVLNRFALKFIVIT